MTILLFTFFHHTVSPVSESVHIGVSDVKYTFWVAATQLEIRQCGIVESPVRSDRDIMTVCGDVIYGRYVYVSLIRQSNVQGYIQLYKVSVYMGEWINEHDYNKP